MGGLAFLRLSYAKLVSGDIWMLISAVILAVGAGLPLEVPPPYAFEVGTSGFDCVKAYEKRKLTVTTATETVSGQHAFVMRIANVGTGTAEVILPTGAEWDGSPEEIVAISSGGFLGAESFTKITEGLPAGFEGGVGFAVADTNSIEAAFVAPSGSFPVTPIPGFKIFAGTRRHWTKSSPPYSGYQFSNEPCEYKLNVLPCTADASIDTRKVFGQPNAEGKIANLDPNSPGEFVRFGTWSRNGGLFVGSAVSPNDYKDRSGIGRIQLQVRPYTIPSGALRAVVASVFCVGVAPQFNQSVTLYGGCPATVGAETEAEMSWGNKWTPPAQTTTTVLEEILSTQTADYRTNPISHLWQYMSVQLDMNQYLAQQNAQEAPTSRHLSAVVMRSDEAEAADEGPNAWWYFASREYVGQNLGATNSTHTDRLPDAHPRFFVLEQVQ